MATIEDLAASVLDVPIDAVRAASSFEHVEGWDSLKQLNLMLAVEDAFGVTLSPDDLPHVTSVAKVAALVRRD